MANHRVLSGVWLVRQGAERCVAMRGLCSEIAGAERLVGRDGMLKGVVVLPGSVALNVRYTGVSECVCVCC